LRRIAKSEARKGHFMPTEIIPRVSPEISETIASPESIEVIVFAAFGLLSTIVFMVDPAFREALTAGLAASG
jgi:hypothetical protein